MRSTLTVFALGLALALAPSAVAGAATVRVIDIEGAAHSVDLRSMRGAEDIVDRPYVIRSGAGEQTQRLTGFSLASVLERADVDLYTFNYLAVARPGGGAMLLESAQARNPRAFPDGPPVISERGGQAVFTRPSSGPGDANAADTFGADPLVIELRRGALIQVEAFASKQRAKAGEPIEFRATVAQAGAGAQLQYSWSFDDGKDATGPSVRHSFAKAGTYDVVVGVTTPSDRTGGSATVTVQVGKPRKQGPQRKGGGTNRSAGAPDSGSSTGASGSGSSGSGSGPGARTGNAAGLTEATPQRARSQRPGNRTPTPLPGSERVVGELLRGADGEPVSRQSAAAEQEATRDRAVAARVGSGEPEDGASIPGAVIGVIGALGLLGLGALAESERLHLPRVRLPRERILGWR